MVMIFSSEEPRKQLLKKEIVYTMRKKERKEGRDWATDKYGGKKIADVSVRLALFGCPPKFYDFVKESGFKDFRGWMIAAQGYGIGTFDHVYLYEVIKIDPSKEEEDEN